MNQTPAPTPTPEPRAEDDFVQLRTQNGKQVNFLMSALGLETWPPPEIVKAAGMYFRRVSHSALTREQTDSMPNVARGGLYHQITDAETLAHLEAQPVGTLH